ncbi:uncharacterized protein LOC132745864 [Ruditapes philippinarum]|uniref:uncharacterized protein LOC132745864 n=1 Tax=Ruditapes philippinarum TaxID=129788 RepID=UPI00295ABD4D|nr:uncharacterized protein LOC132745864 [Ruditapes philippinarum]
MHKFTHLELEPYKTYYQTVIAETEAGSVSSVSDGVTVVVVGDLIRGISVLDGPLCSTSVNNVSSSSPVKHEVKSRVCLKDVDFQLSTNVLQAHWTIPYWRKHILKDIFWVVEKKDRYYDKWKALSEYQPMNATTTHLHASDLTLFAGRRYRVSLKFCAGKFCFKPVQSDGVFVVPNDPKTGKLSVTANRTQIEITLERFVDSDIESVDKARDVLSHYEWALADKSFSNHYLTEWKRLPPPHSQNDKLVRN